MQVAIERGRLFFGEVGVGNMTQDRKSSTPAIEKLDAEKIGFSSVLFQSITTVAPGSGIAIGLPLCAAYAGGALPLAVLLAAVVCVFVALTLGQLAKHLPSAGGLTSYTAHGLGNGVGFVVGWAMALAYTLLPVYSWGFAGIIAVQELQKAAPSAPHDLWIIVAVASFLLVLTLQSRGIGVSSGVGKVMGFFEIAIFAVVALILVIKVGHGNTLSVFAPHSGNAKGFGDVIPAAIYAMFAFSGFEAAAPIGEESKDPGRNVGLAMLVAVGVAGFIYLICSYAWSVFVGPAKMQASPSLGGGNPWIYFGDRIWAPIGVVIFLVILNSVVASCNSSTTAATRMAFSFGRARAIPRAFAGVKEPSGAPIFAIRFLMIIGFGIALIFGLASSNGSNDLIAAFGTAFIVMVLCSYLLVGVSCTAFYLRKRRNEFNVLRHLLIPAISVLLIIPMLIASIGTSFAGLAIQPVVGPARWGLWIAVAWSGIGIVYAFVLSRVRPEVLRNMHEIYVSENSGLSVNGEVAAD